MESIMIIWSQNGYQNAELLFAYIVLGYPDKWILTRISTSPGGYPGTRVFFPGLIHILAIFGIFTKYSQDNIH